MDNSSSHILVGLFALFVCTPVVQAQSSVTTDDEIERIEYTQDSPKPIDDRDLLADLSSQGFQDVTTAFAPLTQQLYITHVLASPDLEKFIVLRYDFQVKNKNLEGRYLRFSESRTLVHTVNREHRHVAVLTKGLTQSELNRVSLSVSKSKTSHDRYSAFARLMIPPARASEALSCGTGTSTLSVIRGSLVHAGAEIMRTSGTCAAAFRSALADSIVGSAWSFLKGNWNFSITKMFTAMKQVMQDGSAAIVKIFNEGVNFSINSDVLSAVFCYALTTAAADFITGAVTGGASLPLLIFKSVQKIEKVARWMKTVSEYRVIRNVRYLSSALKGEKPAAHLRDGDLLTKLTKDDGNGNLKMVRERLRQAKKVDDLLDKSISNGTCIAVSAEAPGAIAPARAGRGGQSRDALSIQ